MQIGNLPIAGNAPPAMHNENRQRNNQFRTLEHLLVEGETPAVALSIELLRLNAPNAAQTAQRLRDSYEAQNGELLDPAAPSDQKVTAISQDSQHPARHQNSDTPPEPENHGSPGGPHPFNPEASFPSHTLDTMA